MSNKYNLAKSTPSTVRQLIRENKLNRSTTGIANGFIQANLVILKKDLATDFLLFCQRDPKPCPLLEVTDIGSYVPKRLAKKGDLRTDIGKYRIYKNGSLIKTVTDIVDIWEKDLVSFLLGCSVSFEDALVNNGIKMAHQAGNPVPMYITNIQCIGAGVFKGPMVVSMRPIPEGQVKKAIDITSKYPETHGTPVHIGSPEKIGISKIDQPDYGKSVHIHPGEVPVFWACGVTPQIVAKQAKPNLMITHEPGYMFVTDLLNGQLIEE